MKSLILEKELSYEKRKKEISSERRCPFIQRPPSNDCYCVNLNSLSIEALIYYCGKNFLECKIYRSLSSKNQIHSGKP